ncbi:unnamed protein product [Linum tenue]|uniref:Scarecrow-like protein 9 n=1 Tax=Linum tenue TaxID=586396 RepID=A0AAV0JNX8_9ROSI|nr:unnamed protein product [Linum tenue]
MYMGESLGGLFDSVNGLKLSHETLSGLTSRNLVSGYKSDNSAVDNKNPVRISPLPTSCPSGNVGEATFQSSRTQALESPHDDFDFSDVVLKYITDMLMEEDMGEKACMFQESSAALQAAEKSLYELIGERYPPTLHVTDQHHESLDESHEPNPRTCSTSSPNSNSCGGSSLIDSGWSYNDNYTSHSPVLSSSTVIDSSFAESPLSSISVPDFFAETESAIQFRKGFEEASKFIPRSNLALDVESNGIYLKDLYDHDSKHEPRGKKNPHPPEYLNLEVGSGRSSKQSAVSSPESTVSSADFDRILLNCAQDPEASLRAALQSEKNKTAQQNRQTTKGLSSSGGRARGKRQGKAKQNVVDLRTLLTLCAQAVAADDRRNSNDLLKQIRDNASQTGDGMQRLAYIFADGLEARLAGSGTQIYKALITKPTSAADVLKAYQLFLAACPFRKLSNFFSNKTTMNLAQRSTTKTLHIVEFGILYGFQWPCLIQRLSSMPGGPPKLRITGVDFPNPGFRPAERVEETGRRLANYARTFNVPFEFNAIAQKWDTIRIEDLKIEKGEVLVVNCLFRLRNLLDETVVVDCPRNIVLNLVRKMRPDVFILGVVNGAYSAPFFITRFREALFHYSTLFDMLETTVPRDIPERKLIEREIFGWEAMNVIACEGAERLERPETYKQCQVRMQRAGFTQLPLNRGIFTIAKEKVKENYDKDFVIDEDGQWLLQGWKGRILYALSTWKPIDY